MKTKMISITAVTAFTILMAGCSRTPALESVEANTREASVIREAAPPPPTFVEIPSGTSLKVRLNQSLSTVTNRGGEMFSASLASPVVVDGRTVIPIGTEVKGIVRESVPSGRLKGRAVLSLALLKIEMGDVELPVSTASRTSVSGKHKKRNWSLIGGGAGTGAAIGALAGGGIGAGIGAGSGATAGLVTAAFTGKKQVRLPAETLLTFRLNQPIEVPVK